MTMTVSGRVRHDNVFGKIRLTVTFERFFSKRSEIQNCSKHFKHFTTRVKHFFVIKKRTIKAILSHSETVTLRK